MKKKHLARKHKRATTGTAVRRSARMFHQENKFERFICYSGVQNVLKSHTEQAPTRRLPERSTSCRTTGDDLRRRLGLSEGKTQEEARPLQVMDQGAES
jgi:hypothetical protein